MAWKTEVVVDATGKWFANGLRFSTREEAEASVAKLPRRWSIVYATRVVETNDPANSRWTDAGRLEPIDSWDQNSLAAATAVVVAAGRSLQDVCLPLLQLTGAMKIAVNSVVHHAPYADYLFTLDAGKLDQRFELPWFAGEKVAAVPRDYGTPRAELEGDRTARRPDTRYLERVSFSDLDPPNKIMTGCSGFGAFQFAFKFLGATKILLLGCDHDEQGAYFYGRGSKAHPRNWSEGLSFWNQYIPPAGVEAWNVSPFSRITSLPKIGWKRAFKMLHLPLLPVVTVLRCGGEFNESHVEWLQRQVGYPIVSLTDSQRPMRNVISLPLKYDWPGWWSKLEMFRDDLFLGNFLYADLDTVFIGGIPPAFEELTETHVLSDFRHPWINSGLMFLHHSDRKAVWDAFISDPNKVIRETESGGDQVFIDRFLHNHKRLDMAFPNLVVSYNFDVVKRGRSRPPNGDISMVRVVCFHGRPRPWHVEEPWIPELSESDGPPVGPVTGS